VRSSDADIRREGVASLSFLIDEYHIGALAASYQITVRHPFCEKFANLVNQMSVEIFPQAAGLDIRIHAREW
jgi:hypothetical protein